MGAKSIRVYCAGPIFNAREQGEMEELDRCLREENFETFLPQRDGIEFATCIHSLIERGFEPKKAALYLSKGIFALDVYQVVVECDGIVVNLNGRVPDEGAVSEAALAWCSGKVVVAYKADHRSLFMGQDNPLVAGLFGFHICPTIGDAVGEVRRAFSSHSSAEARTKLRREEVNSYIRLGKRIWKAMNGKDKIEGVARVICQSADRRESKRRSASLSGVK